MLVAASLIAAAAFCIAKFSVLHMPPAPSRAADDGYKWGLMTGAGLRIWAESSYVGSRHVRMAAMPDGFGVQLRDDGEAWTAPEQVIRVFKLKPGEPIGAIAPLLKLHYRTGADCRFQASPENAVSGEKHYQFVPFGKTLDEYNRSVNPDEPPSQEDDPCGDYGSMREGINYFAVQDAHPDTVIYMDLGEDEPLFDERTMEVLP